MAVRRISVAPAQNEMAAGKIQRPFPEKIMDW
jgi:hypothetical protein